MNCPKCGKATATDVNEVAWCVCCGARAGRVEVWGEQDELPMGSSTCWQQTTTESEDIVSGVFDTDCDLAMCQYLANSREYISGQRGEEQWQDAVRS